MRHLSIYVRLVFFTFCYLSSPYLEAAYTIKNGRIVDVDKLATLQPDQHFSLGQTAMNNGDWQEASRQFAIVSNNFPNNPYGQQSLYYLGIAEFNLKEYDFANKAFSAYLKCQNNPPYFLEAIEYKYAIAEQLRGGAKRRLLGTKQLPKWSTGKSLALAIYDEVITAMPSHEMAAQALYAKGCLLWEKREYRLSIESFQLLCSRFPKNELTPTSYVNISCIYYDLCQNEPQNPDVLAFAELNAKKFIHEFPKDERIDEVRQNVQQIKECYATALYETARYYEKIKQPRASLIYYSNTIKNFPDTLVAQRCRDRLEQMGFTHDARALAPLVFPVPLSKKDKNS